MIITIIAFLTIILGIIFAIQGNKTYSINLETAGAYAITLGIIGVITCICVIIPSHSALDAKIQQAKYEYESLEKIAKVIDSDYEDVSKIEAIEKITQWNMKVYSARYWSENKWTNWFWDKRYVDSLEYIELEGDMQ